MPKAVDVPENYDERRQHIKSILDDIEPSIAEIIRETGRPKLSQYHYALQVLNGYPGKVSPNLLNDIETVLKYYDLWEEMSDVEE
jgi:hypothetical protein